MLSPGHLDTSNKMRIVTCGQVVVMMAMVEVVVVVLVTMSTLRFEILNLC